MVSHAQSPVGGKGKRQPTLVAVGQGGVRSFEVKVLTSLTEGVPGAGALQNLKSRRVTSRSPLEGTKVRDEGTWRTTPKTGGWGVFSLRAAVEGGAAQNKIRARKELSLGRTGGRSGKKKLDRGTLEGVHQRSQAMAQKVGLKRDQHWERTNEGPTMVHRTWQTDTGDQGKPAH